MYVGMRITLYSGFVLVIWLQFCFLLMEILSLADYKLCTGIMYHQNLSLNIFYSLLYKLVFVLFFSEYAFNNLDEKLPLK